MGGNAADSAIPASSGPEGASGGKEPEIAAESGARGDLTLTPPWQAGPTAGEMQALLRTGSLFLCTELTWFSVLDSVRTKHQTQYSQGAL